MDLSFESAGVILGSVLNTVKSVNKGQPRESQNMAFLDRWSLFGGYIALFFQGRGTDVWPLFTGWSLFGGGLSYRFDCTYNSSLFMLLLIFELFLLIILVEYPYFIRTEKAPIKSFGQN